MGRFCVGRKNSGILAVYHPHKPLVLNGFLEWSFEPLLSFTLVYLVLVNNKPPSHIRDILLWVQIVRARAELIAYELLH